MAPACALLTGPRLPPLAIVPGPRADRRLRLGRRQLRQPERGPVEGRRHVPGRRRPRGPGAGTKGIEAAADYIAGAFKEAGLKPPRGPTATSSRSRSGRTRRRRRRGVTGRADRNGPRARGLQAAGHRHERSSRASRSSSPATGSPPRTTRKKLDYDDYAGLDVKGKAVLIIRREPQQDEDDSPFDGKQTTDLRHLPAQGHQRLPARRGGRPPGQRPAGLGGDKDELLGFADGRAPSRTRRSRSSWSPASFADKLLAAAGQPDARRAGEADRRRPQAPVARAEGLDARRPRSTIERTSIETQERGRRARRVGPAGRRDGRRRRPLRPPRARRA